MGGCRMGVPVVQAAWQAQHRLQHAATGGFERRRSQAGGSGAAGGEAAAWSPSMPSMHSAP